MKIKEFIQGRNVSYDTVRRYISNHPEVFKGHVGRPNNVILDDYAVQLLDKKYPFPQPIQIVEDTSSRQELASLKDRMLLLHEKYTDLLEENNQLQKDNADLLLSQHRQLLLEEDNGRLQQALDQQNEQIDRQDKMIIAQNKKLQSLLKEKSEWDSMFKSREREIIILEELLNKSRSNEHKLEEMLAEEKSKSWWDKLRNR